MARTAKDPRDDAPRRELRADAQRNRDKLLAAADAVFSERGADASLEDVARRAKVGIGTLYRHFPTREALLAAACDEGLLALANKSCSVAASVAPAEALGAFIEELVRHVSRYEGLAASFGVVLQSCSPGCQAATEEGRRQLARAQLTGEVRRDVEFDDVVCMVTAISLAATQSADATRRIPRLVSMFVDGLRARDRDVAPRPATRPALG
ncbi:TetR family transcriptional regulator [Sorangium cellulosum]|uniref:TetR family transcriptional regulator n=1 Tax=Sorangium cellulosum TaxID=56 RepID=A0A2L0F932_SORCE|nr:TetR/AcrR family transcriptional regulator [Sorangium cellulosum]AUX48012.1 TetR family transcriptional regulator [Sorangium cellulosum]